MKAIVLGPPAAMGSKKAFLVKGKINIVDQGSAKLRLFQTAVRESMMEDRPEAVPIGPICLVILIHSLRPKSHYSTGKNARVLKGSAPVRPTSKPDWHKIARAICDCGTGIWWKDDAQITSALVIKAYAGEGEPEGVYIEASEE